MYEASPANVSVGGIPLITIAGGLMVLVQILIVMLYFVFPSIGLQADQAIYVLLGSIVSALVIFYIAWFVRKSKGEDLKYVFEEIPPE